MADTHQDLTTHTALSRSNALLSPRNRVPCPAAGAAGSPRQRAENRAPSRRPEAGGHRAARRSTGPPQRPRRRRALQPAKERDGAATKAAPKTGGFRRDTRLSTSRVVEPPVKQPGVKEGPKAPKPDKEPPNTVARPHLTERTVRSSASLRSRSDGPQRCCCRSTPMLATGQHAMMRRCSAAHCVPLRGTCGRRRHESSVPLPGDRHRSPSPCTQLPDPGAQRRRGAGTARSPMAHRATGHSTPVHSPRPDLTPGAHRWHSAPRSWHRETT